MLRGTVALHDALKTMKVKHDGMYFQWANMTCTIHPLRRTMLYFERMISAIREDDVPRAAQVIDAARHRGLG